MNALLLSLLLSGAPETPRHTEEFLDSMGVCTHWTYPDTPYGFAYERVRDALKDMGVRHVRDGWSPRMEELAKLGIRTTLVCEPDLGTPREIVEKVRAINAKGTVVEALEGPNEPDLFWVSNKKTYKGKPWPDGAVDFLKDLWSANLSLGPKRPKVYGIALGKTYDPGGGSPNPFPKGSLTPYVDYGNFHPYPGGNPFSLPFPYAGIAKYYWQGNSPSNNLDEWPYAFNTYRPPYEPKPMVATETGYSTNTPGGGVHEATHAKLIPRLFAEYFRLGVVRTFSYELVDEFVDPDGKNREAHFGLLRRDVTPKPAFTALKSLIALLRDDGPVPFRARPVEVKLTPAMPAGYTKPELVHRLLLQKRNGSVFLLIWHEISPEDTSVTPAKVLTHPPIPATLSVTGMKEVTAHRFGADWRLRPERLPMRDGTVSITIDDRIQVIQVR